LCLYQARFPSLVIHQRGAMCGGKIGPLLRFFFHALEGATKWSKSLNCHGWTLINTERVRQSGPSGFLLTRGGLQVVIWEWVGATGQNRSPLGPSGPSGRSG